MQIAIPSYHRPARIAETTLPLLRRGGVDMSTVTVFLTDETELEAYRPTIEQFGINVEVGHAVGMAAAANHIARTYPVGTRLVRIDDDVSSIVRRVDDKTLAEVEDITALFERGFREAAGTLWCVYPAANPFYMGDRVRRSGLWYAEGCLFGYEVTGQGHELVSVDHGEDYERSIKFFEARGAITRLDGYSFKSKFWKEPGGMQETRTPENIMAGLTSITRRYPDLARLYYNAAGRPNLRLKVIR
ncbi:hypothetical protein PBI_RICH_3 [Mycobacterium phage Rich]|uniref:Glycosyltransferase n=1 Tax=Mycobacterium phage Rich TaxID=1927021 RepID=A0A1L6BYU2_9CAUD|nr:hypothetical protein PBI_RICH_3 [Mycobacterium phage Rich]